MENGIFEHEDFQIIEIKDCGDVWFIYMVQRLAHKHEGVYRGWLHKYEDLIIGSDDASSNEWEGYYKTKEEAEERLKRYLNFSQIYIGGE